MPPVTVADALHFLMATPAPVPPATATSPGSTALLSAAIAGAVALVTVLITHHFTRNRSREEWTRERIYEATSGLVDTYRAFMREVNDWKQPEGITVSSAGDGGSVSFQSIREDRTEALDTAYHNYSTYLNKLELLMLGVEARDAVDKVRTALRELWDDTRTGGKPRTQQSHSSLRRSPRMKKQYMARVHQELTDLVKRSYFVSSHRYKKFEREAYPAVLRPDGPIRRQGRKKASREAKTSTRSGKNANQ